MRHLVWRGIHAPMMEIAHVESWHRARGTQVGVAYELRWEFRSERLSVELVGGSAHEFELADADFFDLLDSAFFNSLPVVRDGLLEGGEARDYLMRYVSHPPLAAASVRQRYEPIGDRTVRFTSGEFERDIDFDDDGYVNLYHGYLERIG